MRNNLKEEIYNLPSPEKTYLEILKVNNKEIPMGNLLAYFFRPWEKHGLNTLFIEALLKTKRYPLSGENTKNSIAPIGERKISNVKVDTEVGNNERIDILINSDEFIICIEFKINHDLNNPLSKYQNIIKEKYNKSNQKDCFFIVLTPSKKTPIDEATKQNDFKQIILSHFVKKIRELKGQRDFIFNDFLNTIENRSNRKEVWGELNKIYKKNDIKIETATHIPQHINEYLSKRLSRTKVQKLGELLKDTGGVYHEKGNGFIEIKTKKRKIKIRIKGDKWQVEKWHNNTKEIIKNFRYDVSFKEIENYVNSIL